MTEVELEDKKQIEPVTNSDNVEGLDWIYVIVFNNIDPPVDKNGNAFPRESKQYLEYQKKNDEREQVVNELSKQDVHHLIVKPKRVGPTKFILITAPEDRLVDEAERIQLNKKMLPEYGGSYDEFSRENIGLFRKTGEPLFSTLEKIRLVESILLDDEEAVGRPAGVGLNIPQLLRKGVINKFFPLHEEKERKELLETWGNLKKMFKSQDIDRVRDYLGEENAMYFAWLGFYTTWLVLASFFGFVIQIPNFVGIDKTDPELETWPLVFYSVFIAIWSTLFLEFWKRYQNQKAFNWGVSDFEEQEQTRPDYVGVKRTGLYFRREWINFDNVNADQFSNAISELLEGGGVHKEGEEKVQLKVKFDLPQTDYYPQKRRMLIISIGFPIILFFVILVSVVTVVLLSARLFFQRSIGSFGGIIGSVLNAINIMIFNNIWKRVAEWLTRWENHRTMTSYNDQLTFKIFVFQFINSYFTLYYIGFFKSGSRTMFKDIDACKQGAPDFGATELENPAYAPLSLNSIGSGCIRELLVQLVILLGTNITVGQTKEVLVPFLMSKLKEKLFSKKLSEEEKLKGLTQYEREANLSDHQGTFDEYNEMVIQYGFVTLFGAAFPLAPLMAVINNVIEIRTDAFKMLTADNRPHYRGAQDIGTWYLILEVFGVLAVVTNCALLGFTYPGIPETLAKRSGIENVTWKYIPAFEFKEKGSNVTVATGHDYLWIDPTLKWQTFYYTFGIAVLIEHILLALKFGLSVAIPDVPGRVRSAVARADFLKGETLKMINRKKAAEKKTN